MAIQDYKKNRQPKTSAQLYEWLLKYESRLVDRSGVSVSRGHYFFTSHELRNGRKK